LGILAIYRAVYCGASLVNDRREERGKEMSDALQALIDAGIVQIIPVGFDKIEREGEDNMEKEREGKR
jgi:hypothetical protein